MLSKITNRALRLLYTEAKILETTSVLPDESILRQLLSTVREQIRYDRYPIDTLVKELYRENATRTIDEAQQTKNRIFISAPSSGTVENGVLSEKFLKKIVSHGFDVKQSFRHRV